MTEIWLHTRETVQRLFNRKVRRQRPKREYESLTPSETQDMIYCLCEYHDMGFGDIAMTLKRDQKWVREQYENYENRSE